MSEDFSVPGLSPAKVARMRRNRTAHAEGLLDLVFGDLTRAAVLVRCGHVDAALPALRDARVKLADLVKVLERLEPLLPPSGWVSARSVARVAGCDHVVVLEAIERGDLVAERWGGSGEWRVRSSVAARWLEERNADGRRG